MTLGLRLVAVSLVSSFLTIGPTDAQYRGQQGSCTSPRGTTGTCIAIRECPPLLNILQQRPLRPEAVDFLRQSQCGFQGREPMVCCENDPQVSIPDRDRPDNPTQGGSYNDRTERNDEQTSPSNPGGQLDLANNRLLPRQCGRSVSQRIVGGERTELDEFPWMALLEYRKPNGKTTACGGVLINSRYVLTAAHCVKGKDLPTTWRLESVRLGEYNTDTDPDCIEDGSDTLLCADDPISVGVEQQIAHEEYRPLSRDQRYDIALLRLSRDVSFTNYIKPICLPSDESMGHRLYVAGWGKTENRSASNVKLKVSLPPVERDQCQRTYGNAGITLGYGQICAGGQRGKDSCRGDSGGPLMALERGQDGVGRFITVGVVSFGPSPCGMPGWPGVYTRVIDFVPWILANLQP